MTEIVAIDIGGTHARFAIAEVADGGVRSLGEPATLRTGEHAGLAAAWQAFRAMSGRPLPRAAAIAFAGPVRGDLLKLTNNPWTIAPSALAPDLGVDRLTLVNDFGAVAHAVAGLDETHYAHVCGPSTSLSAEGVISVIGPGTGLGVAQLLRRCGRCEVIETEGGHSGFAPLDEVEDRILADLRTEHRRVSVERVVGGAGLANIRRTLAAIDGRPAASCDDATLWAEALSGADPLADAALRRYFMCLGAVAGDLALAHGAAGLVIAGGLGLRLAGRLAGSGFATRFVAKGRFERRMAGIPVKLLTYPQPGLYGAAAAFALEHR